MWRIPSKNHKINVFLHRRFSVRLAEVIESLVEEKGLDPSVLSNIICEGMLAAYTKKYIDLPLRVKYNQKADEIQVEIEKTVVPTVENEVTQISTRKAKTINAKAKAGDTLWLPFEGKIGRIEILRAKQVIAQKIRTIESAAIYNEFKEKQGTIVHGVIHKCERAGTVVKLADTLAFLPKSLTIPEDKCIVGYPIRALLKEVLQEPRNDNQLILDRSSDIFLQKLFELEIPEVFEKLVEIKKIVRTPGYKSKVVVVSNDSNIDPVGTCVGVGGARIKPILKELASEKIDVIPWSDDKETLVKNALKPAQIQRVQISDDERSAQVWLDEDQRSLAIGKMGQNIFLASKLADININLMPSEQRKENVRLEDIQMDEE